MNLTRHRLTVGVLWAAFAGLAVYFFFTLDLRPLRIDEIFSIYASDPVVPLADLVRERLARDVHPPLFYVLLHFWQMLVGSSDVATRAFGFVPYLAGALSIAIAVRHELLGKELIYFSLLFLTNLGVVWYVEEVRSYALILCCSLILVLLMLAAIRAMERNESPGWLFWAALVIVSFTTSLSHYFGLLNAGGTLLCLAWLFFSRRQHREFLATIVLGTAVLVTAIVWIVYTRDFWLPGTGEADTPYTNNPYPIFWSFSRIAFSLNVPLAVAAVLAFFIAVRGLAGDMRIRMVIVSAAISFTAAALISLNTPIISGRNLIILLPAVYYVIARSFCALGNRTYVHALVGVLLLISLIMAMRLNRIPAVDWRSSGQLIREMPGCERGLIPTSPVWVPGVIFQDRYLDSAGLSLRLASPESVALAWYQNCPVVLWAGQTNRIGGVEVLMQELRIPRERVSVEAFRNVYVVLRN